MNCHISLQSAASGLHPLPTYFIMWPGYAFGTYTIKAYERAARRAEEEEAVSECVGANVT
jgi:hypothetical protein